MCAQYPSNTRSTPARQLSVHTQNWSSKKATSIGSSWLVVTTHNCQQVRSGRIQRCKTASLHAVWMAGGASHLSLSFASACTSGRQLLPLPPLPRPHLPPPHRPLFGVHSSAQSCASCPISTEKSARRELTPAWDRFFRPVTSPAAAARLWDWPCSWGYGVDVCGVDSPSSFLIKFMLPNCRCDCYAEER